MGGMALCVRGWQRRASAPPLIYSVRLLAISLVKPRRTGAFTAIGITRVRPGRTLVGSHECAPPG
jgi:hypothetical protein